MRFFENQQVLRLYCQALSQLNQPLLIQIFNRFHIPIYGQLEPDTVLPPAQAQDSRVEIPGCL